VSAPFITLETLRDALIHLRDRCTDRRDAGAYLAGGIDALTALLPEAEAPAPPPGSLADLVRKTFERSLLRAPPPRAPVTPVDTAPPAAPDEAQPAAADPPIAIPPLPTGPGATPPGVREAPAACSAIPAPSPSPVLAAEGPRTTRRGRTWNAERDAVLAREVAAGTLGVDILPLVNAIPGGKPVASQQAIYARINVLGLRRPNDVRAEVRRRAGRIGAAHVNRMVEAGEARTGMRPQVWTPERNALGKRMWEEDGATAEAIQAAANELPAPAPVSNPHSVQTQAAHQGWQRSAQFVATKKATAAAQLRAMQVKRVPAEPTPPAPEPALVEPAVAAPTSLAAPIQAGDEKQDAFAYFTAGKFVRDVVEDFGVGVTTAVGWHAEWKRQQGAA
jgi:hypothetical protein